MSTSMYQPVDDDTRTLRYDEWSKNIMAFAKAIGGHVPNEEDDEGRNKRPCPQCVTAARVITQLWFQVMMQKYKNLSEKDEVPLVGLDDAYFMAASLLEPEVSVQIADWGPA